jgi:hypothetical protein
MPPPTLFVCPFFLSFQTIAGDLGHVNGYFWDITAITVLIEEH